MGIQELLPGRSVPACFNMARRLGLVSGQSEKKIKWSAEEIKILENHYPRLRQNVASLLPGKTEAECRTKAGNMGLLTEGYYWTDEEDAILREYYPKEGYDVSRHFPNKARDSCISRIHRLKLRRIKSTDAAAPQVKESPNDEPSSVKLSPDAEDTTGKQPIQEDTVLAQTETPQTGDDIDEEQQEEPSSMQFGSMHM